MAETQEQNATVNGNGGETVKRPKKPFVKFDGRQAKEIVVDAKAEFASIILYKELKFVYQLNVADLDVETIKSNYLKSIEKIFKLLKVEDTKIFEANFDPIVGKNALAFTVLIPYNLSLELIMKKLFETTKFLNSNQDAVIYKMRNSNRNIAWISVYKNVQANDDIFVKGFAAVSHENESEWSEEKNFLRAGLFLRDDLGFSEKQDIIPFNYGMIFNKVSLYNETDEKVFTYTIPFKRSFKVVLYQLEGSSENKKFSMTRNEVVFNLHLKEVEENGRTKKISSGVFVDNKQSIKEIDKFSEIFDGEDGNWILDDVRFDANSIEASNFKGELESIDEVLIDSIDVEVDDETPSAPVENEPEKPAEEPKKEKKTKKNKKKDTEVVAEENTTPPTPTEEEEIEVFNDVGSLADVDLDADDESAEAATEE